MPIQRGQFLHQPPCYPSYGGCWILPRQDCLLLNLPAFAGHTGLFAKDPLKPKVSNPIDSMAQLPAKRRILPEDLQVQRFRPPVLVGSPILPPLECSLYGTFGTNMAFSGSQARGIWAEDWRRLGLHTVSSTASNGDEEIDARRRKCDGRYEPHRGPEPGVNRTAVPHSGSASAAIRVSRKSAAATGEYSGESSVHLLEERSRPKTPASLALKA